jgi:transposase
MLTDPCKSSRFSLRLRSDMPQSATPRSKTVGLTLKQRDERRAEVARRLRAGQPDADVAKALGLAVNSVYAIGAKAREHGLRSRKGTPRSGRSRKIGKSQWPAIVRRIAEGPRRCGFDRDLWTLPPLQLGSRSSFSASTESSTTSTT